MLDTETVLLPTRTASKRMFQRDGELGGQVEIASLFRTAAYSVSTSPGETRILWRQILKSVGEGLTDGKGALNIVIWVRVPLE